MAPPCGDDYHLVVLDCQSGIAEVALYNTHCRYASLTLDEAYADVHVTY